MKVAILGNGITGVTAALRLRQRHPKWQITLVSGESTYHWSRPALMYIFMGHMQYRQTKPFPDAMWKDRRIDLRRGWVTKVDVDNHRLELHEGADVPWDRLLIATGAKPNKFGWPGQDLDGVQGMYGLQDLERLYRTVERTRAAVIVGGGLIGIELAEMLHSRHIPVTMLVREDSYWDNVLNVEESNMVNRLIREQGIGLELKTNLASIEDDGQGRCAAAVTDDERRFECELVGLTAGVAPNVAVAKESGIPTGRGVLVDKTLRAQVPDVYAAGDCAEIVTEDGGRNLIQQVWYTGKMQGVVAADNIAGDDRTYDPGVWFNSAKFLDVDYHTYGAVNRKVPDEQNLYWEHDSGRKSARLVLAKGAVIGLQTMGLRWRHEVAQRWIQEERTPDDAIRGLAELAFEPEFHTHHTAQIEAAFREQLS